MVDLIGQRLRAVHSSWRAVDVAAIVLRAAVAMCFITHGGPKLFSWLGSTGMTSATAEFKEMGYSSPHVFATISGLVEFVFGIFIAVGFATVLAAAALIIEMLVAIWTVAFSAGIFGANVTFDGGWEVNYLLIGLCVALLVIGPGPLSVDQLLGWTRRRPGAAAVAPPAERAGQAEATV